MKEILITGSSGYIGSHLCKMLAGKYIVHGLDISDPIIPVDRFHKIDIRNSFTLNDSYDAVIHLAALVNVNQSELDPISYYNTNLTGTINTFNISCDNYIFASTGAAITHKNVYGMSKKAAEQCVLNHMKKHHIDHTIFRFYNVIGSDGIEPTNVDGLMYNLLQAPKRGWFMLYGTDYNTNDGTCIRDYVHVNEICHALMLSIEDPSNQIEHLGHGIGRSVKNIIENFKSVNDVQFTVYEKNRRIGDEEINVLTNPSRYMHRLYDFSDLIKVR